MLMASHLYATFQSRIKAAGFAASLVLFFASFMAGAHAEESLILEMIYDISPGAGNGSPIIHAVAGNRIYFSAYTPETGSELWVSDGTTAGTFMVKDIRPGTSGSSIFNMAVFDNRVFFTANDGTHGNEIWTSDGTSGGTHILKDIAPGAGSGAPAGAFSLLGQLFFPGNAPGTGLQPWVSDGTADSTVMLKRINAEGDGINLMAEVDAVEVPALGLAFFQGYADKFRRGLWRSDGTAAGTEMIVFFSLGGMSYANPINLTACSAQLFFSVLSNEYGTELWATDGTAAGTYLVKDIIPGDSGSGPRGFYCCDDILYFWATDGIHGVELWRSDGTEGGTWMVADIAPGASSSLGNTLACLNEFLIVAASHPDYGSELWRVNRDGSGAALIKDVRPGALSSYQSNAQYSNHAVMDNVLYVTLDDGVHGSELWRTDGFTENTWMVEDLNPGHGNASPLQLTVVDESLFFSADNGIHGTELWRLRSRIFAFTLHPAGKHIEAGKSLTLRVETTDAVGEIIYQWRHNGIELPGATEAELYFPVVLESDAGWYSCMAMDESGKIIESAVVPLRVSPPNSLPLTASRLSIFVLGFSGAALLLIANGRKTKME